MPTLVITPPSSWQALDEAIAHLSEFDWLILTSSNGVNYFFQRLRYHGKDARALAAVNIAVVGKKTAASLREYGIQPDFIPPDFVADSLVEHFPEPPGDRTILFPRVETGGREVLVQQLTARGFRVVEVAAYESKCPDHISPEVLEALQQNTIDIITFTSAKTVKNFYELLEESLGVQVGKVASSLLETSCIASIGPQTSASCRHYLGRVDREAEEYTLDGLLQVIVKGA